MHGAHTHERWRLEISHSQHRKPRALLRENYFLRCRDCLWTLTPPRMQNSLQVGHVTGEYHCMYSPLVAIMCPRRRHKTLFYSIHPLYLDLFLPPSLPYPTLSLSSLSLSFSLFLPLSVFLSHYRDMKPDNILLDDNGKLVSDNLISILMNDKLPFLCVSCCRTCENFRLGSSSSHSRGPISTRKSRHHRIHG